MHVCILPAGVCPLASRRALVCVSGAGMEYGMSTGRARRFLWPLGLPPSPVLDNAFDNSLHNGVGAMPMGLVGSTIYGLLHEYMAV